MATDNLPATTRSGTPVTPVIPEATMVNLSLDTASPDETEGISTLDITLEEGRRLQAEVPIDHLEIKPTGEVYASQTFYRRRLNEIFGPGGWGLRAMGEPLKQGTHVFQAFRLYVRGKRASDAVGECEYQENNARMTWGDALEGVRSNALTRCCKDFSIAWECWDKRFTERYQNEHCVLVWVEGQKRPQWRRKDARPFYGEKGTVSTATRPTEERGPAPAQDRGSGGDGSITEPQRRRLYAIWKKSEHDDPDVMAYLKARWNLEKTAVIPKGKIYDTICTRLANPAKLGSLDDDKGRIDPETPPATGEAPSTDDAGIPEE